MIRRTLLGAALLLAALAAQADVTLSIRFFDKRIYFPGSEVPIMVTISNDTAETYRFKLADDRIYSLSFEARTPANRQLDLSDAFKVAMSRSEPVFYRELAIKPGEEYSFKEDGREVVPVGINDNGVAVGEHLSRACRQPRHCYRRR